MPQHIRNQHIRQEEPNPVVSWVNKTFGTNYHISTKQSFGTIVSILLLLIILVAVAGHYMRFWTIPGMEGSLQKAAPASHLQYFFF
jgi:hypothetical protein